MELVKKNKDFMEYISNLKSLSKSLCFYQDDNEETYMAIYVAMVAEAEQLLSQCCISSIETLDTLIDLLNDMVDDPKVICNQEALYNFFRGLLASVQSIRNDNIVFNETHKKGLASC